MKKNVLMVLCLAFALILSGCFGKDADSAQALLEDGKFEAAADAFNTEIEADDDNVELYAGLADAYIGLGEYEAAVDILCDGFEVTEDKTLAEKMVKITSDVYRTASEKIDYQVALYCSERTLECTQDSEIYKIIASCYLYMQQPDKAIETVKTGIEKTEDISIAEDVASQIYTLGSKAFTSGDKKAAKEYFDYVLEIDADNEDAANMLKAIGENPKVEKPVDKKPEDKKPEDKKPEDKPVNPEPKPEINPPAQDEPSNEVQGSFVVQIGAYGEKANADKKVAAANAAGFSASYYEAGGLYHVTIGTFSTEAEANECVAKAVAAGFSAVILY